MLPAVSPNAAETSGTVALTPAHREETDPLVTARALFFSGRAQAVPARLGALPQHSGLLGRLLAAEYAAHYGLLTPDSAPDAAIQDVEVASLRRACRHEVPLIPEALLAHPHTTPRLTAVLTEMWPATVRRYGGRRAESALRDRLTAAPSTDAVFQLEAATAAGLRPLSAAEATALADTDERPLRHAAWRYLHSLPGGHRHLPPASDAADVYERLLLEPPAPALPDGPPDGGGALVAQSMLLGGLDTPGKGSSGGLSVLLGGLGDALAATEAVGGVLTVVAAGHEDLARDPRPVHRRSPGHWILRLPVDAPAPPPQTVMHQHAGALTWWAVRLLQALPRRLDVLHVRYADDGSLALARAADRIGARLVFTATPDPHRDLSDRHAAVRPDDTEAADALRHDLHRVFVADRLVERADTVVGIPGPGGTRELVRHFPKLAALRDGAGPAGLPEGIAAYRPAPDEKERRTALLNRLFDDGTRPDALDRARLDLPVLLTVGRLHPVKQQDLLVRAWLVSGLYESTQLVVVGGDPQEESGPEELVRRRIESLLATCPAARRRCALVPALPNQEVRRLERALADPERALTAWYVCPSLKEEFGLAVLEAMEAGLPVAGPLRGGVAHYVRDGENGLLLDTSGPGPLIRGLRRLTALPPRDRLRLARHGRELVETRYSAENMAAALSREYLALTRA